MNVVTRAKTGYSVATSPTRTLKSVEYQAIAEITHRLRRAAEGGSLAFPLLAQALHDNRRLWTIFASDVATENNSLSADLRGRIFYLAKFTRHHSRLVLSRKAGVGPLLEINSAILRGLQGKGE